MFTSLSPLARENAELREQLQRWEHLAQQVLVPFEQRTGALDLAGLHSALARVASLALQHDVPHQQLMDAVRPDPRGTASGLGAPQMQPIR